MGQSLAKVSLVATMATLLSRFSFKLAEEVSTPHITFVRGLPHKVLTRLWAEGAQQYFARLFWVATMAALVHLKRGWPERRALLRS